MVSADIGGIELYVVRGSYRPPYRERLYSEVQVLSRLGYTGESNVVIQDDGYGLTYIEFDVYADIGEYGELVKLRDLGETLDVELRTVSSRETYEDCLLYSVGPMENHGVSKYRCPIRVVVK